MKLCWLLTTYQSHAVSAHWRPSLVSDKHITACRFQLVSSPGASAMVWVFMQLGVKVNGAYYCDVLLLKQLLHDIYQVAGNFCFPAHHACARALSCCDTRLRTSHQTWLPNRPYLSSVDYRLPRVIQECVCQKQQGMSYIVDELSLLTEWYFINKMTYYISQARVEAPIKIGGQLCYSSVANLLQYLCAKNYQNIMQLDKVIAKNKKVQFFCPTV